jgi:hypothetical protein
MSKTRLLLIAAGLGVALALGLALGWGVPRLMAWRNGPTTIPTTAVVRQIQTLSQLVTVRYVIEKVVVMEDVKWFGENRVLLVAHGVVNAGVNLEELAPDDLEVDGQRIRLRLPKARIVDAYLDESRTQVIERSTGLLRMFDKELETVARQNAVTDVRSAARQAGILDDAQERASLQLEILLRRLGFEEVEITNP